MNLATRAGEDLSDHPKYFTEHLPATRTAINHLAASINHPPGCGSTTQAAPANMDDVAALAARLDEITASIHRQLLGQPKDRDRSSARRPR